ncbi:MAG: helix-turn-helix domain-containing protein [Microgenomates group bacterium]
MLTTGQILKKERERLGLTLENVEKATKIRKKSLIDIENGDFKKFASKTYVLGIIRSYGDFLNLDALKLAAFFRREYERTDESSFKQRVGKQELTSNRKRVFGFIIALVLICFGAYFAYQVKLYLTPPQISIISPTKTSYKNEQKIELVGKTEKEASVTVNGERVYTNEEYIFRTFIPLVLKENIVRIEVTGANGRKATITKTFYKR